MIAGAKYRGEERLKAVLKVNSQKAESCSSLMNSPDCGELVRLTVQWTPVTSKPMLARGELHCIGATTLDEYRENIEKDKALELSFSNGYLFKKPTVERYHIHSAGA